MKSKPQRLIASRNRKQLCGGCGGEDHPYMLRDDLWQRITADSGAEFLCLPCAELALGEPLKPRHFDRSIPINSWLRWHRGVLELLPGPIAWAWIEAYTATQRFILGHEDHTAGKRTAK
jgi:hypothetical protein